MSTALEEKRELAANPLVSDEHLFTPLEIRGVILPNRIAVSPMCQYSAVDGVANDWHLVHLGSRAVGGAGLVVVEATAVEARGRISPGDLGLWNDEQEAALARIGAFIQSQGSRAGIQIAHAGRKASTDTPWKGGKPLSPAEGGWEVVGPSPIPFGPDYPAPQELRPADIAALVDAFAASARRADRAGFDVLEIHGAHGYLIGEFLSPLSNIRSDQYGGSFENRIRFALEVTEAVRSAWPQEKPLFVRISATDWAEGGWDIEQSVALARRLRELGVDLIDVSSGGLLPHVRVPVGPGYQTPFAAQIRKEAGIRTGAVGEITAPEQADHIIRTGQADIVLLARELLRNPYWPLHAARKLKQAAKVPSQYGRAFA